MKKLQAHPAAEILPPMESAALTTLTLDIKEQGLLEPIAMFEGQILDGRNRYQACVDAGVKPVFEEVDLNGASPLEYVMSRNLQRRHLTTGQKAALALRLLPYFKESALLRRRYLKGQESLPPELSPEAAKKGDSAKQVAAIVGLGHSTVEKAIQLQKRNPDVIEKMWSGEIKSVEAAMRASGGVPDRDAPIKDGAPLVYYGKGDRWREATMPMVRYLRGWQKRKYEFRHVNHTEARRRLKVLDELIEHLNAVQADLEPRSVKAQTSLPRRGR